MSIRVAGRLLTRLAKTELSAAIASRSGSEAPVGSTARTAVSRPLALAAWTITPSPRTKIKNPGSAAGASATGVAVLRASAGMVIAAAPAAANQTGSIPTTELSANPASVNASTATANRGSSGRAGRTPAWRGRLRSTAKKRLNTTHSTPTAAIVGSTINSANRTNDSPLAWNARRLVRLDTGSGSDAELARCAHA
jgi:hypothetical protein